MTTIASSFWSTLRVLRRSPARACCAMGLACGLAAAGVTLVAGVRVPAVQDEFCYLLQADTFAHGRLTNPPHPMARHFETVHVLQHPTYTAKYPPAHGMVLAAAQVVTGQPMVARWLLAGVFCAAVTWMLWAWVPGRWAVFGGLLAALHFGSANHWVQMYGPMPVVATAGALVYGALPRLLRRPRVRESFLLGLGLAILANSRPFTGLLLSLPAAVVLLGWAWSNFRARQWRALRRAILPVVGVLR